MSTKQNTDDSSLAFHAGKLAQLYIQDAALPDELRKLLLGRIRARNLSCLTDVSAVPVEYQTDTFFPILRQVSAFFSKNDTFSDEATCSQTALRNFHKAERHCRITNKRLDHFDRYPDRVSVDLIPSLRRVRRIIAETLGSVAEFQDRLPSLIRLTSGATTDRSRSRAFPFLKITGQISCPTRAVRHITRLLPHYGVESTTTKVHRCDVNRVEFVPKNWKTHRSIACEPTHVLPLQLAVDAYLKRRLRSLGVDLSSQKRNQELARIGSIDGSFATLDLAMASDTLAVNTVAYLLPDDWFVFLDDLRSPAYKISLDGSTGVYSKFSSMGNGFTFTLETLIFTAICKAVCDDFAVYGDDIVCPTSAASQVVAMLQFLGFRLNKDKSFYDPSSRFRESCGCDYMNGVLVTPIYVRSSPKANQAAEVAHVCNSLLSIAVPSGALHKLVWDTQIRLKILVVPYNHDTRSGVMIHPSDARRRGLLFWKDQMPYFMGYCPRSATRRTRGWRSLLLWHLTAMNVPALVLAPNRAGDLLLHSRRFFQDGKGGVREALASQVTTRTTYVKNRRLFSPVATRLPAYLFAA